jgi:hypothetical protein
MRFYFHAGAMLFVLAGMLFSCSKKNDQQTGANGYTVTINNGYGSGKYSAGDTVHIFSKEWSASQVFDAWSGDVSVLPHGNEWHEWFIMPARNILLTANFKSAASFSLVNTHIRGRDIMKNVYYYFPPGHKGIVYLLHGSFGTAENLVNNFEQYNLIKDLVTDGFGVIITESEESSFYKDSNGDGKIRWALTPVDTINNVDYANIRILTDSLIARGLTTRDKPRYSVGMSNGGAFSAILSYTYNFKAGVSYCAQSGGALASVTKVPLQFCMARNDNNENVGAAGNAEAISNSATITNRGQCSKIFFNERSPVYEQRFARRGDISFSLSASLVNELKAKGYIDAKNFFIGSSEVLSSDLSANPSKFPVLSSLSVTQKIFVKQEIECAIAGHQFYDDLNKTTLTFLNSQCR